MIKKSLGEKIFGIVNIVILAIFALISLYPMLYVVFSSISDPVEYMRHSGMILKPVGFSLEAYKKVLSKPEIATGYLNTLFYVGVGTAVNMAFTISLGYVLSRKNLLLNKFLMVMVIITMYFGGGLVPTYLVVKSLGLVNTRWAIIFPSAISTYNLIIMRAGFLGIPDSLEEAANIDGASPFQIMTKIIMPLAKPTISVLILYYAVGRWNSWFTEAIYLRDLDKYPLQLFLRDILITNNQQDMMMSTNSADQLALGEIIKYATIIVSTLPILILYPFLQKHFTKGVMVGAVKG